LPANRPQVSSFLCRRLDVAETQWVSSTAVKSASCRQVVGALECQEEPISLLGPDWFEKVGVKSNNEDFDFPD
jgi:hypothetical protein